MDYEDDSTDSKPAKESAKGSDWAEIHEEALEEFKLCEEREAHNREEAIKDLRFARLSEQWHDSDKLKREQEGRPCMTINKMPAFIRQVVNDGRQNKPAIKVHPADDQADPKTAEVINGLIRNIEYASKADTAYDTGLDFAVTMGFGYWGVDIQYAHNDAFEMDIVIVRKPNPFAIYGDYASTATDSSDWMRAFEVDTMECEAFEKKYKGKEKIDWESDAYKNMPDNWRENKSIRVAKYWCRKEVEKLIHLLSDGRIVQDEWLKETVEDFEGLSNEMMLTMTGVTIEKSRKSLGYEVKQYVMNGVEILEEDDWAGQYIPLVPIYGEELNVEGKRYFRSMIRDAKDAQRNFNYWRTTCTELVALAPKAPFIGPVGSFVTDADKWATANTQSHAHIEYDVVVEGGGPPERQPFAGVPAGALQEALNASDDMKAVIGMYDASLGARSNETSGRAINARKSESDTGTFHFIDNQSRAIRCTGVIVLDLIPHVYNKQRIIRVMGVDKKAQNVPINQPLQGQAGDSEDGIAQVFDLTVGKYDLTVDTGPSFQTKREEAAYGMTELMRALPATAPVIGPHLAKAQDWPEADKIADELAALAPGGAQNNPLQQQVQQLSQQLQQATQQLQGLQQDRSIETQKLQIDQFNAETTRMKAQSDAQKGNAAPIDDGKLPEAQKIALEAEAKERQLAMTIAGQKELKLMDIGQFDPAAAQQENSALYDTVQHLLEQVAHTQKLISAPRKKTLIRGPDGRAIGAQDEIDMPPDLAPQDLPPQEQPQ